MVLGLGIVLVAAGVAMNVGFLSPACSFSPLV